MPTSVEGENFNHRLLWFVVKRQLEHARMRPVGAAHDELVAMVFAFHSMEAYLNFIGERLDRSTWTNERTFFSKEPYRGFAGKMKKVLELVGLDEPSREARPYSTIWLLKNLRDQIAHPKTERYALISPKGPDEDPWTLRVAPFQGLVTRQHAEWAYVDVETLANGIHERARKLLVDVVVGESAFSGPFSLGSGSAKPEA